MPDSDPNYRPYCLMCDTMGRMTKTEQGFRCEGKGDHFGRPGCGNEIGHDFKRLPGTPGPRRPYQSINYADIERRVLAWTKDAGKTITPTPTGRRR